MSQFPQRGGSLKDLLQYTAASLSITGGTEELEGGDASPFSFPGSSGIRCLLWKFGPAGPFLIAHPDLHLEGTVSLCVLADSGYLSDRGYLLVETLPFPTPSML